MDDTRCVLAIGGDAEQVSALENRLECDYQLGLLEPNEDRRPSRLANSVVWEQRGGSVVVQLIPRYRSMVYWLRSLVKSYPNITLYAKWLRGQDRRSYMAAGHNRRFIYTDTDESGENLAKSCSETMKLISVIAARSDRDTPSPERLQEEIYDLINQADAKFRSCVLQ